MVIHARDRRLRRHVRRTFVGAAVACGAVAGCGDGAEQPSAGTTIATPRTPTAEQCAQDSLRTPEAAAPLAPRAGAYSYAMTGTQTTVAETHEVRDLPPTMSVLVTPTIRQGRLLCFALQRRITTSLSETATFVVRGSALYVSQVLLETANGATALRPAPPLLAVSADQLDWSGAFTGRTRGQYVGRVVGRREISVGGTKVRAVGVALDSTFAGEVTGRQRSVQWFSARRHLLLVERVVERRRFGLDDLQLAYTARLRSLDPEDE